MIDEGETPEQCAVRELKEETGYVGVVEKTSTVMFHGNFLHSLSFLRFNIHTIQMMDLLIRGNRSRADKCQLKPSPCTN